MKIEFRRLEEYLPVDLKELRPKKSYDKLVENRSYPIKRLLAEHGGIPKQFLQSRTCPNCQSAESALELTKEGLDLRRCSACDLVYVSPIFNEDHYKSIYKDQEYQEIVKDLGEASHDYRVQRFGVERIGIMQRFLSAVSQPRYLDVGCSTGFVVEAAARAGWKAEGLDLNPSAIEFGKERGLSLRCLDLFDGDFADDTFDAVSLFDVLEHLSDPARVLKEVVRILRPGGIAFMYVPNYDSASRILLGQDAHFIWPTHHLTYFTPTTFPAFVGKRGLEVEYLATEGLDLIDYVWWKENVHHEPTTGLEPILDKLQFFINAGCYGKNLRLLARKPG